ncbi:MAG: MBL fold metallo-hydrolase [bacterium]
MPFRITPYGGADSVTGSNFLIEGSGGGKILVDCGIEQGRDVSEADTYAPFPYDASQIDALVITHAHLDHVGRCPKLAKEGFRGRVYMTPPTRDLAELILRDSAGILAQEAQMRHLPLLYTDEDVTRFFSLVETLEYHTEKEIAPGLSVCLRNTGHILGSASVRIRDASGSSLALTGDIGNSPSPFLPDAEPIPDAGALLMESVYGDRLHPHLADRVAELRDTLKRAIARGGTILIPSFSMERTQLMLYEFSNLMAAGEIPKIPVFLDSPLAIGVTAVYEKWGSTYFKQEAKEELEREGSIFNFPFLKMTSSREQSEGIAAAPDPKIIIAGAGMSHGGRIGAHEARYLPFPTTTLIMVGYQAPGTPGRLMQEGAPSVRLGGREVRIRAKIETLSGWSAHADRDGLMKFVEACLPGTKTFFVAIGEPSAERFLAQRIHDTFSVRTIVPETGEGWEIGKDSIHRV